MIWLSGKPLSSSDLRRVGDIDNIIPGERGMRHQHIDRGGYVDDTQQGRGSDSFPLFLNEEIPLRVFNGYQDRGICGSTFKLNDFRQGCCSMYLEQTKGARN